MFTWKLLLEVLAWAERLYMYSFDPLLFIVYVM